MNNEYTCHSGGCPGADMAWETEGEKYGVKTIAYSFYNHKQEGKNPLILSISELQEGYAAAKIAAKSIKRPFDTIQYSYVKNLLARNWFQVKNSDVVFAIAKSFLSDTIVEGGTGWAVQMAIDNKKTVCVYDQKTKFWYKYDYILGWFECFHETPVLTNNFAGIGTRELTDDGKRAIVDVYKNTFGG